MTLEEFAQLVPGLSGMSHVDKIKHFNWFMANHLAAFNAAIPRRYPKRAGFSIIKKDDFEELKESETIEVCGNAGIVNDNTKKILNDKLTRRNVAAHPSLVEIKQYQA